VGSPLSAVVVVPNVATSNPTIQRVPPSYYRQYREGGKLRLSPPVAMTFPYATAAIGVRKWPL